MGDDEPESDLERWRKALAGRNRERQAYFKNESKGPCPQCGQHPYFATDRCELCWNAELASIRPLIRRDV